MFYARYLRAELLRRKGRTILTLLGLALGVGLVITISSLSSGLDDAQKTTLDPLAGIGTDLTVTPRCAARPEWRRPRWRRRPRSGRGQLVRHYRPVEAGQAGNPVRP